MRLLEREAVAETAAALLRRAAARNGGALFVQADAGLGKTAVLGHVADLARPGFTVGHGRGDSMERWIPFGLFGQIADGLGANGLFDPPARPASAAEARAACFYAVLRRLEAVRGPVLLALDDVHWADPESCALLAFICRRLGSTRVALVAALRQWPGEAAAACRRLAHEGHAEIATLPPLSPDAAGELLTRRLGRALPAAVLRRVCTACAGNPLLLEQAGEALRCGELGGDLVLERPVLPSGSLVLSRFAELPAPALRFLQAASILGGRFHPGVAGEVASLREEVGEGALRALACSGLVREAGGVCEFVHPAFHETVYADLSASARTRLHARAVTVLSGRGADREAAEHAVLGGPTDDPDVLATLSRVGLAALEAGALPAAERYLATAVELAGAGAGPDTLLALGDVRLEQGRVSLAAVSFQAALAAAGDDRRVAARALHRLGRAHAVRGRLGDAVLSCREGAVLMLREDPAAAVAVLLEQAYATARLSGPAEALALVDHAGPLLGGSAPDPGGGLEAVTGYLRVLLGDPHGLAALHRAAAAIEAGEPAPDRLWARELLHSYAVCSLLLERFGHAERILGLALAMAERDGASHVRPRTAVLLAELCLRQGRLAEALSWAEHAAIPAGDDPATTPHSQTVLAAVLLRHGDLRGCQERCDLAPGDADTRGPWSAQLQLWHVRGQLLLARDHLPAAARTYTQLAERCRELRIGEPCTVLWQRSAVTAFLGCGLEAEAAQVLRDVDDGAASVPCSWPRIAAAGIRAAIAERRGDREQAEASHRAAAGHAAEVLPLEHIQSLLDLGRFLRRAGRLVEARVVLAEAHLRAESAGDALLATGAHAELRVAGGRRHRSEAERQRLTVQEDRVARLAAAGCSNQVIAGRLSVAVSTVKTHLERVYAKLDVQSRHQLAGVVPRFDRPANPVR
ncbi:MAG TPA: AAA family ATPase [Candidatus Dormibacteraeota bacterium]